MLHALANRPIAHSRGYSHSLLIPRILQPDRSGKHQKEIGATKVSSEADVISKRSASDDSWSFCVFDWHYFLPCLGKFRVAKGKMVQMRTVLRVADNSGAKTIRCINILRRLRQRPSGNVGSELVVSVTSIDRAVRNKKALKGEVHRALVIRSKNEPLRSDGGFMRTGDTAAILLTADGTAPMGTRIKGPVSAALDRSRYLKVLSLAPVTLYSTFASAPTSGSRSQHTSPTLFGIHQRRFS